MDCLSAGHIRIQDVLNTKQESWLLHQHVRRYRRNSCDW